MPQRERLNILKYVPRNNLYTVNRSNNMLRLVFFQYMTFYLEILLLRQTVHLFDLLILKKVLMTFCMCASILKAHILPICVFIFHL